FSIQPADLLTGREVPEADGAVLAGRGDAPPVRREGQPLDPAPVAGPPGLQPTSERVPDADHGVGVGGARHQRLSIRREDRRPDLVRVPEVVARLTCGQVPERDGVAVGPSQALAVPRESGREDLVILALELAELLTR